MTDKKPDQEPGTAVARAGAADEVETSLLASAKTFEERQQAFTLAASIRQHEMVRKAAAALAETGWGKAISPIARAAVARYLLEIGADPMRHAYVLGGNVYMNAAFYMELVASNPKFLRSEAEFVHDDPRLTDDEKAHRRSLRVKYGVPEGAPGACVVTLYYDGGRGPFVGVNWAGVRDTDPVGKAEPTKTAETRAYRKAALKAEPAWFRKHPKLTAAEEVLAIGRTLPNESEVAPPALPAAEAEETPAAGKTEPLEEGKP